MGRGAVGGEEQQSRGHDVETTNVREAGHLGEEVVDGAAAFGVTAAHHVAERLVERVPDGLRRGADGLAVHGHLLRVGIDTLADGRFAAVDLDATGADQLLGLAA